MTTALGRAHPAGDITPARAVARSDRIAGPRSIVRKTPWNRGRQYCHRVSKRHTSQGLFTGSGQSTICTPPVPLRLPACSAIQSETGRPACHDATSQTTSSRVFSSARNWSQAQARNWTVTSPTGRPSTNRNSVQGEATAAEYAVRIKGQRANHQVEAPVRVREKPRAEQISRRVEVQAPVPTEQTVTEAPGEQPPEPPSFTQRVSRGGQMALF